MSAWNVNHHFTRTYFSAATIAPIYYYPQMDIIMFMFAHTILLYTVGVSSIINIFYNG